MLWNYHLVWPLCITTINPVAYEGGEAVFIDTEYDTWNMDPITLGKAFEIYPDVRLIVVAYLYGIPWEDK